MQFVRSSENSVCTHYHSRWHARAFVRTQNAENRTSESWRGNSGGWGSHLLVRSGIKGSPSFRLSMTSHPSFNQPTTTSDLSFVHFFLTKKNFQKKIKNVLQVLRCSSRRRRTHRQHPSCWGKETEKYLTKYNLKFVLLQINQSPKSFNWRKLQ